MSMTLTVKQTFILTYKDLDVRLSTERQSPFPESNLTRGSEIDIRIVETFTPSTFIRTIIGDVCIKEGEPYPIISVPAYEREFSSFEDLWRYCNTLQHNYTIKKVSDGIAENR